MAHVIGPSGSGKSMNLECAGELNFITNNWIP